MDAASVLIADDHPLAREGLTLVVRHALPGVAVRCAGTLAEAEMLVAQGRVRLLLLDLMLPDTRGFSGLLHLRLQWPEMPIVIVTACEDTTLAGSARDLGAAGFLPKSTPLDLLSETLRTIASGQPVFLGAAPPVAVEATTEQALQIRLARLSGAQRRVLFALADGRANKLIAQDLGLAETTVKAHLTAIFRQLGVSNRMQAMLALQPLLGEPSR